MPFFNAPLPPTNISNALGYIAPPFPDPLPNTIRKTIQDITGILQPHNSQLFSLKIEGKERWIFDIPPKMSIEGQHDIVRRKVFKQHKGTLKERWRQDDYKVVLEGWLVGKDTYPKEQVRRLQYFFEQEQPVHIQADALAALHIHTIVFTHLKLPFTQGEKVQYYVLNGVSDSKDYTLFENP